MPPGYKSPLCAYQAKRDFTKTPEPPGKVVRPENGGQLLRFAVQRHRARRLHYDLRLEMSGVLASWAIPKGPTLDPRARRAAFHVEDHPVDYIDFEGVIPKGQYGAGDVIVWDEGFWAPVGAGEHPDPVKAVREGELHFDVAGHKLRGRFVLVRTGAGRDGKEQWLLLKKRDRYAVEGWDPGDYPRSVISGRTNDEVNAGPEHTWGPGAQVQAPAQGRAGTASCRHRILPAQNPCHLGKPVLAIRQAALAAMLASGS